MWFLRYAALLSDFPQCGHLAHNASFDRRAPTLDDDLVSEGDGPCLVGVVLVEGVLEVDDDLISEGDGPCLVGVVLVEGVLEVDDDVVSEGDGPCLEGVVRVEGVLEVDDDVVSEGSWRDLLWSTVFGSPFARRPRAGAAVGPCAGSRRARLRKSGRQCHFLPRFEPHIASIWQKVKSGGNIPSGSTASRAVGDSSSLRLVTHKSRAASALQ
jgi:hypothetical protein